MSSTRVSRLVPASAASVYGLLLDADALARWRVPDGMTATVHELDPVEGGFFRVSLRYDDESTPGKSGGHTDTYHGRFVRLVADAEVVEVSRFETDDPSGQEWMTMTTSIRPVAGGCEVTVQHDGVPASVSTEDNEVGTRMALDRLAALAEEAERRGTPPT